MAKKEITSASSPAEIQTAQEELARAQLEINQMIQQKFAGKSINAADLQREAQSITSKYDYVDFGQPPSVGNEINIGGDKLFVKGLNNQTNTVAPPNTKTTVNADDAFPTTKPPVTVTPNTNPKSNNPNQAKINQNIGNDTNPVPATESPAVQPSPPTNPTGNKDATEAGAALESNTKKQAVQQDGIINQNKNNLPTTNNLPGRLSDEFSRNPQITNDRKGINSDDAGAVTSPMGTAITGFGNDTVSAFPDPGRPGGSGAVTFGTDSSIPTSSNSGTPNKPNVPIRENILHNYANWTYKIGFYALKIDDYNSIIEGSTKGVPAGAREYPLAVSGGYQRKNSSGNLARDIYIDSLRFTSIIGNRLEGKATNNIDIELQLIEPYSANFLGELALLAMQINGNETTIGETPYLLEIDFTGYTDAGEIVPSILKDGKKYIPVKIISADMKIDSAGARYTFGLVPYSFYMFTQKKISLPKDVWVYGEKVDEILGDNELGLIGRLKRIETEKVEKDKIQDEPDTYAIKYYSFDKKGSSTDQLANSVVAFPTNGGPATIIKNRKIDENKPTKQGYTIKAGTLIKDVIQDLVLTSEYFNLKMNPDGQGNKNNSNPAELLTVIPQVKLTNKWDKKRNEYAKEITYHVFNTLLFGETFPHGGQALVGDWGYSKVYNYIFTGKNTDILDLDINFNLLYYTTFFTDKNELGTILTDMVAERNSTAGDADTSKLSETTAIPGNIAKTSPNEPSRYINASLASEFINLKMNNSNADMIQVTMSIIGDPDWIPQDSSIRGGQINVGDYDTKLDKNGSIAIDVAGVYAKLQLRTPMDYNDSNGMMNLSDDKSLVGGVYQVLTVDNVFQGGKFTSTLTMNKIPNQEENKKPTPSAGSIANPTLPGNPR